MTYSYLLTVPLIAAYAIGFTIIKYYEGFVDLPVFGVVPRPYQMWGPVARRAIFPLMLLFSVGWSLEMVTHLEELCFWLFLVNSGSAQQDWFRSLYFKTWVLGSTLAIVYMPLVTIFTRSDPLKSEAYTFLAGSLGSLSLTLWFTPILWTFPGFLRSLRHEGVDINTIVRLTKFSELNMIRVVFRFMFTVPLLILGIDGVRDHRHINESMLWTDFLAIIAGFGCSISSGITLVIFFPRSIEGEIAARDASRDRKRSRSQGYVGSPSMYESRAFTASNMTQSVLTLNYGHSASGGASSADQLTTLPVKHNIQLEPNRESFDAHYETHIGRHNYRASGAGSMDKVWNEEERDHLPNLPPLRPNRKQGQDVELGGMTSGQRTPRGDGKVPNVNQMVQNFTSPIDLVSSGEPSEGGTWLSFSRR